MCVHQAKAAFLAMDSMPTPKNRGADDDEETKLDLMIEAQRQNRRRMLEFKTLLAEVEVERQTQERQQNELNKLRGRAHETFHQYLGEERQRVIDSWWTLCELDVPSDELLAESSAYSENARGGESKSADSPLKSLQPSSSAAKSDRVGFVHGRNEPLPIELRGARGDLAKTMASVRSSLEALQQKDWTSSQSEVEWEYERLRQSLEETQARLGDLLSSTGSFSKANPASTHTVLEELSDWFEDRRKQADKDNLEMAKRELIAGRDARSALDSQEPVQDLVSKMRPPKGLQYEIFRRVAHSAHGELQRLREEKHHFDQDRKSLLAEVQRTNAERTRLEHECGRLRAQLAGKAEADEEEITLLKQQMVEQAGLMESLKGLLQAKEQSFDAISQRLADQEHLLASRDAYIEILQARGSVLSGQKPSEDVVASITPHQLDQPAQNNADDYENQDTKRLQQQCSRLQDEKMRYEKTVEQLEVKLMDQATELKDCQREISLLLCAQDVSNQDGTIDLDAVDWASLGTLFGDKDITPELRQDVCDSIGIDDSHSVDPQQFVLFAQELHERQLPFMRSNWRREKLRTVFGLIDQAERQYVDQSALLRAFQRANVGVTLDSLDRIVAAADVDGDGELTFADFCRFCEPLTLDSLMQLDGNEAAISVPREFFLEVLRRAHELGREASNLGHSALEDASDSQSQKSKTKLVTRTSSIRRRKGKRGQSISTARRSPSVSSVASGPRSRDESPGLSAASKSSRVSHKAQGQGHSRQQSLPLPLPLSPRSVSARRHSPTLVSAMETDADDGDLSAAEKVVSEVARRHNLQDVQESDEATSSERRNMSAISTTSRALLAHSQKLKALVLQLIGTLGKDATRKQMRLKREASLYLSSSTSKALPTDEAVVDARDGESEAVAKTDELKTTTSRQNENQNRNTDKGTTSDTSVQRETRTLTEPLKNLDLQGIVGQGIASPRDKLTGRASTTERERVIVPRAWRGLEELPWVMDRRLSQMTAGEQMQVAHPGIEVRSNNTDNGRAQSARVRVPSMRETEAAQERINRAASRTLRNSLRSPLSIAGNDEQKLEEKSWHVTHAPPSPRAMTPAPPSSRGGSRTARSFGRSRPTSARLSLASQPQQDAGKDATSSRSTIRRRIDSQRNRTSLALLLHGKVDDVLQTALPIACSCAEALNFRHTFS